MTHYEIKQNNHGEWYFTFHASNGMPIAGSVGYPSKSGALNGIHTMQTKADTGDIRDDTNRAD